MQLWYKEKCISSGKYRNSTVRKEQVQGGNKAFQGSNMKDVDVNDVDDVKRRMIRT